MARRALIIGAGITGALTAHRLARAGWGVTVVEARHLGAGSSSRTAAGIRQQFSIPETVVGMRYSVDYYRRFTHEVGGATTPIVQNGYLFLHALTEAWETARARVAMQRAAGLAEVEALDARDLVARFPFVDGLTVLGGTFCPSDGFLRPDVVYAEAMASAVRAGAVLVQNAEVTGCEARQEGPLDCVQTTRGSFSADIFIDATNAWSPRLGRLLGASDLPISPLKRYLWMVERAGSLSGTDLARMPLTISPSGAYCRPENSETLMMGWAHDAQPEPEFSWEDQDRIEPAFFHKTGVESHGYEAWMSLAEVMPPLGEFAGITATTSGYYATTPDHNPFLGFDGFRPNLIRLAGFSGHGAMFGPFTALIGAALAEAGRDIGTVEVLGQVVPITRFSIGRTFGRGEGMVI